MRKDILLSIVIPVYNSEKTINVTVKKIMKTLSSKLIYEIILVNDGSKDNSYTICKNLTKKYKFVKLIDLSKNFGQHNAILAGYNNVRGDYIICMDDDLQTPPEELWKLINKLDEGYDAVYAKYISKKHTILKRLGSNLNGFMLRALINKPKNLFLSSYCAIRRFLVDEIKKYEGPNPYLWGLILRATSNITNVEVKHRERKIGKSNYSIYKLIKLFLNGFINFSVKPLRFIFSLGCILALISIIFTIRIIIMRFIDPSLPAGWTSLAVMILFFSGVNLISLGLIGEYLGRSFLYQSKYTQYLIREKLNFNEKD